MAKGVWEWPTTLRSPDTVTLCHLEAAGLIVGQGGLSQGSLRCQSGSVNSCPEARMQSTADSNSCAGGCAAGGLHRSRSQRGNSVPICYHFQGQPQGTFAFHPQGSVEGLTPRRRRFHRGSHQLLCWLGTLGSWAKRPASKGRRHRPRRVTTLTRGGDRAAVHGGAAKTMSGTQEGLECDLIWIKGLRRCS